MNQNVINNYDWQELQRKLQIALSDKGLQNLMLASGHWESTCKICGVSQDGWDLLNE